MSQTRFEVKVGAFILVGLVLLAVLVLLLSKGTTFYRETYQLRLKSGNVGGIKTGANVLLSGVSVGRVSGVDLNANGTNVIILLKIFSKYQVHADAQFNIEQFGFLGDQYVAIHPRDNEGPLLKDGDEVVCAKPFNMQETVARAAETISKIGQTATNLDEAVSDVRQYVLTEQTLKHLAGAIDRFALVTAQALDTVSNVNVLVASNALPVTLAISNLNYFTTTVAPLASRVDLLVSNNEGQVTAAIQNIESASGTLTNLMNELQGQRGLAGRLLHDQEMAIYFSEMTRNLADITSTLNRRGLWGLMWGNKKARNDPPSSDGN